MFFILSQFYVNLTSAAAMSCVSSDEVSVVISLTTGFYSGELSQFKRVVMNCIERCCRCVTVFDHSTFCFVFLLARVMLFAEIL